MRTVQVPLIFWAGPSTGGNACGPVRDVFRLNLVKNRNRSVRGVTRRGAENSKGVGDTLIILLGGGTKARQQRDIESARALWQEYRHRKEEEV